jgi:hypothetical protein
LCETPYFFFSDAFNFVDKSTYDKSEIIIIIIIIIQSYKMY